MKLSQECSRLEKLCDNPNINYQDFFAEISPRTHALVTLVFGFPFLLPIPLPGLSIPFGIIIALAGFRMALGLGPWIPHRLADKKIPAQMLKKVFAKLARLFLRIEPFVKPRLSWATSRAANLVSSFIIFLCGAVLALPLPPGTNAPPAFFIVLLSIGTLEEDGVVISVGSVLFFGAAVAASILAARGINALIYLPPGTP